MQTESVWEYPRPPAVEISNRLIQIVLAGETIVETTEAIRVLETSHPPVFYVPRRAVQNCKLLPNRRKTFCEFKGVAHYVDVRMGNSAVEAAAWFYPRPTPGFESITDYLAFYPGKMDECRVDGQLVVAQASDFYGGWITPEIEGPFKG